MALIGVISDLAVNGILCCWRKRREFPDVLGIWAATSLVIVVPGEGTRQDCRTIFSPAQALAQKPWRDVHLLGILNIL